MSSECAADKWISVEERLPDINTTVLVIDEYFVNSDKHAISKGYARKRIPGLRFGYVTERGEFRTEGVNGLCKITRWRPLPTPPQEEE